MIRRAVALLLVGCGGGGSSAAEPVARVGDELVDAAVVRMVAARDGVSETEARARVADTLRAVAAAKAAAAHEPEPTPLVDPVRREHLLRAARARVLLDDVFEPDHQPQDIPEDDPLLQRAMSSVRYVHPRLHMVCQLVAVPSDASTPEQMFAAAEDPAWQEKARARFEVVAERMQRYVRPDDREPCELMQKLVQFEQREGDGVTLRVEAQAFDLDACAEQAPDGSCSKPALLPEWVEKVRAAQPHRFLPPFRTAFGWHLVFVREIIPERDLDDPQTLPWLRQEVHRQWQSVAFADYLERLRERKAVRIAAASESAP